MRHKQRNTIVTKQISLYVQLLHCSRINYDGGTGVDLRFKGFGYYFTYI